MKPGNRCISALLAILMLVNCFGFTFAGASDHGNHSVAVAASPAEGGIVSGAGSFSDGEAASLQAVENRGYQFIGWFRGEQQLSADKLFTFVPEESETITARFEQLPLYTVKVNVKGNGQVRGEGTYYAGETVSLQALVSDEDYFFCGWYYEDDCDRISEKEAYRFEIQKDVTVDALFERPTEVPSGSTSFDGIQFEIEPEASGIILEERVPGGDWDEIYLRAKPNEGFRFVAWWKYECPEEGHHGQKEPCPDSDIYILKENRIRLGSVDFLRDAPGITKVTARFEKIPGTEPDTDPTAHAHTPRKTVNAARIGKAGSIITVCDTCGERLSKVAVPAIQTVSLSKSKYTYDAKKKTPAVAVLNAKGKKLKAGTDYAVQYSGGRKAVGTYQVTVTFKGNYAGKKTLSFQIVPGKVTGLKATAGKTYARLNWTPVKGATNYAVYYATSQNGKYKKAFSTRGAAAKVQKLKTGKTYYFRVRALAKTQKGTFNGAASAATKIKIK